MPRNRLDLYCQYFSIPIVLIIETTNMAFKKNLAKVNEVELLVKKLIQATAEDKAIWEDKTSLVTNSHFITKYKDINFFTEWLQIGEPELTWTFDDIDPSPGSADLWDGSLKHDLVRYLIEEIKKQQQRLLKNKSITQPNDFQKEKIKKVLDALKS